MKKMYHVFRETPEGRGCSMCEKTAAGSFINLEVQMKSYKQIPPALSFGLCRTIKG